MRRRLIVLAALLSAVATAAVPALADTQQRAVVSANPVDYTPHILDGTVRAIAVVGREVVVGGEFTRVTDSARRTTYTRRNLFAYDLTTGAVQNFAPALNGPVYALAAGANGTVYAGGTFTSAGGAAQRGLAQFSVATGTRLAGFAASINWGDVRTLVAHGPWLYAGGAFTAVNGVPRVGLARVATTTGAVDKAFDLRLSAPAMDRAKIDGLAMSPNGTRLVAVGAIQQAAGQYRAQLAVLDTSGTTPRLADWYTDAFTAACRQGFDTYLRGVDFSPDGSYFVTVTTGRAASPTSQCDSAERSTSPVPARTSRSGSTGPAATRCTRCR